MSSLLVKKGLKESGHFLKKNVLCGFDLGVQKDGRSQSEILSVKDGRSQSDLLSVKDGRSQSEILSVKDGRSQSEILDLI